ncbi:expressed unknown protein [Seminavis robusta]|uniref:Uncharacterized protein n=1 Tax=Seminavis robusta TaxID=568900 RepID=A0A9N8DBS5_9STRA|nr:expressed unknown protein [Seminavis robusta]|eukprot:Sro48_g028200.1 n/a (89) ;mRNA; r:58536-58802
MSDHPKEGSEKEASSIHSDVSSAGERKGASGSGQEVRRTDASNTKTATPTACAAVFSSPCMMTEAMLLGQYHQDVAQQDTTQDTKESA